MKKIFIFLLLPITISLQSNDFSIKNTLKNNTLTVQTYGLYTKEGTLIEKLTLEPGSQKEIETPYFIQRIKTQEELNSKENPRNCSLS